jgi:hypothetical protein
LLPRIDSDKAIRSLLSILFPLDVAAETLLECRLAAMSAPQWLFVTPIEVCVILGVNVFLT